MTKTTTICLCDQRADGRMSVWDRYTAIAGGDC
jgi:hypothetical protein